MDRDPYELCPCGSGNKLKFCCADVASDMERIERLLANNQPRMALQGLEKLYDTHPQSQWVRTLLASTLIQEDRADEAKKVLAGLLKQHPEQPFANVLYALASLSGDGYPECKRAAHRAFKHSPGAFPELVGGLAATIGDQLELEGHVLAARQYRVLGMRLANESLRRDLFEELVNLDGDQSIPYPLRSVRHPKKVLIDGDGKEIVQRADRYAAVGCWEEAADLLQGLTEAGHGHATLWYNLGLYRAWDGDDVQAAAAFHRAAQATDDFDWAVECEVVAQLLELSMPDRGRPMRLKRFDIASVSQILSRLDNADSFARLDVNSHTGMRRQAGGPAGHYVILSRILREDENYAEWTWESVPLIEGRLTIFDRDEQSEQPAQAFLVGLEGSELDRAVEALRSAVGDLVEPVSPEEDEQAEAHITTRVPPNELPLRWTGYVPPDVASEIGRRVAEQRWQHVIHEIWPRTPCDALQGRTPLECVGDESLRLPLAASLIVFEAYADSRDHLLPLNDLRERLQVRAPQPIEADEQTNIQLLTILEIQRLRLASLSHSQFTQVVKRASLVKQSRLLYEVAQEALRRPDQLSDWEQQDAMIGMLAGICAKSLRRDESLEWIAKGRQLAERQEHAFEQVLQWKVRELAFRLETPDDPTLPELLRDLWHNYGAKLPQLREYLVKLVEMAGVRPPWDSAIVVPAPVGGTAGEEWQPVEDFPSGAERKLWLPGDR